MASRPKDPTEPIRLAASQYPDVDEGTACAQSSFKVGKKSFLFAGMQAGRHKLMFKLDASTAQVAALAKEEPERYAVGSGGWATLRFASDETIPKRLWKKWLDESYALNRAAGLGKQAAGKMVAKKAAGTKAATKKKATKRSRS